MTSAPTKYWEDRKDILYYQVVRILTTHIGRRAKSIIDVGSKACPYLDWFDFIPVRTSIDLRQPYEAEGVRSFTQDFIKWEPDQYYDIVTCLQVLEHVPRVEEFAQKLLTTGRIVIVSVPYMWPAGRTKGHVHDPVDEDKLLSWFGRPPNFEYKCREIKSPVDRVIQVYDFMPEPWTSLNKRDSLINARKAAAQ